MTPFASEFPQCLARLRNERIIGIDMTTSGPDPRRDRIERVQIAAEGIPVLVIQQIPREKAFRGCFTAPPGRRLVIADYSQIELRVAAEISGDKRMLAAYRAGRDLHLLTASHLANKPAHLVDKQKRQAYKAVNLGLIYGMGAVGLRQTARQSYGVEMTLDDATLFRRR